MRVIGIMGPLGAGKSTAAQILIKDHGFVRFSMADPLKAGLRAMGIPEEWEKNRDLREVPQDMLCGRTWRWAAQSIGTEWGRNQIGEDLWVRLVEEKIRIYRMGRKIEDVKIVFDDIRFPNEVEMIRRMGGEIWRVTGRGFEAKVPWWKAMLQAIGFCRPHPSEIYWRKIEPDHELHNQFDIEALKLQVDTAFQKELEHV